MKKHEQWPLQNFMVTHLHELLHKKMKRRKGRKATVPAGHKGENIGYRLHVDDIKHAKFQTRKMKIISLVRWGGQAKNLSMVPNQLMLSGRNAERRVQDSSPVGGLLTAQMSSSSSRAPVRNACACKWRKVPKLEFLPVASNATGCDMRLAKRYLEFWASLKRVFRV